MDSSIDEGGGVSINSKPDNLGVIPNFETPRNISLNKNEAFKKESPQSEDQPIAKPKGFRGFLAKMYWLFSTAVAEPFFGFFMFSSSCKGNAYTNLVKEKVCLFDLNYPKSICDHLHNFTREENEVQIMTNNITMGHGIIIMLPAIVVVAFLGAFADKYGRILPVLLACSGLLLELVGIILCVLDFESSALLLLITSIPGGLSGGVVVAMTVVMSYISETSTKENRTLRFTFMDIALILAIPAGTAYGGTTFEMFEKSQHGYLFVFVSSFVTLLLAMIWIFFRLKEPNKKKLKDWRQILRDLTSLENVKENIRTCTKKREGNFRTQIWLMFISMAVGIFCIMGTVIIGFLFVMKMYDWKIKKYSLVSTYTSLLQAVALCIVIPLLTKLLKQHDCILIVIGSVFNVASFSLKAFAYQEWLYYLGALVGLFSGVSSIGIRSRLSKIVPLHEIGKVFSVMAMCESVPPIIGTALFSQIYNASLEFFPGLVYLTVAALLIIPFTAGLYIYKKSPGIPYQDLSDEEPIDPDPKSTSKF